jgi:hypothetical protein
MVTGDAAEGEVGAGALLTATLLLDSGVAIEEVRKTSRPIAQENL